MAIDRIEFKTQGTCSKMIIVDIEDDIIKDIQFQGGCNGNLKAISKLIDGQTVEYIEEKLSGNLCGRRNTSCADQLAKAVRKAYEESKIKS